MLIKGVDNRMYHREDGYTKNGLVTTIRRVTFKHQSKEYSARQFNRDLRRMHYIQEHKLVKQNENK